jgi:hypothetical protein
LYFNTAVNEMRVYSGSAWIAAYLPATGYVQKTGDTMTGALTAPSFVGPLTGNASTATTLQTARTINGTSFNGGANITTANWGTTRTLTIGGTGKSVSGAANVSWSLAELGAVDKAGDTMTGDLVVGTETGARGVDAKGGSSGTGAGGFFLARTGNTPRAAIGNKSAILGGAFDATPTLYFNGGLEMIDGGTVRAKINTSGKLVSPNGSAFVGTVSNSGDGAIIERGSNANGEYVKYADGTMICTRSVNNNRSVSGVISYTVNLPAAFVSADYRMANSFSSTRPDIQSNMSFQSQTTTSFIGYDDRSNTTSNIFDIIVIGRWY